MNAKFNMNPFCDRSRGDDECPDSVCYFRLRGNCLIASVKVWIVQKGHSLSVQEDLPFIVAKPGLQKHSADKHLFKHKSQKLVAWFPYLHSENNRLFLLWCFNAVLLTKVRKSYMVVSSSTESSQQPYALLRLKWELAQDFSLSWA